MTKNTLKVTILSFAFGLLVSLSFHAALVSAVGFGGGFKGSSSTASDTVWSTSTTALTCPDYEDTHYHYYTNTTGPTDGTWYSARVTKFRIYLHDDFMSSVDLSSLECSSGGRWVSCDGGSSTADGGTSIAFVEGDTSSDAVYPNYVEWTYGLTTSSDSPEIPGYNDYDGDGVTDTPDVADRSMGEYLTYDFDTSLSSGSATTTSGIYIKFWAYDVDTGAWTAISEGGSSDYHWNNDTVELITTYECAALTCASLSISPATGDLSVSDVFSDVPFTVTATGSDGSDITADSTFQYYVNKYGSANTAADADGFLRYGFGNLFTGRSPNAKDSTVTFNNTEPGDSLYVYVSDYDGTAYPDCNDTVEIPYCTDLNITDPTGVIIYRGSSFSTNITVEADASSGEAWPYSITYDSTDDDATYDGNGDPYTTDDYTVDDYSSSDGATVSVGLDDENGDGESDDVAGLCSDSFSYGILNACANLAFTTTGPISAEDMEAGNVEISWTSTMTDGTPTPPPYVCISSNAAGTFVDSTGNTGTGSISTTQTTVYYTGDAGDTVICRSAAYPACIDTITSETPTTEIYSCTDTTLSEPYIVNSDGSHTTLDLTDSADVTTLFDNTTVCYDYTVSVTGTAFSDTLQAAGYEDSTRAAYSGTLQLTVNETGGSDVGNPATAAITGYTAYTGTVCWQDYQAGNYLDLQVLGNPLACYEDSQLPTPTPTPGVYACTDLELSPDAISLAVDATDAGTQTVTVVVTADNAAWTGTLMVTKSGSGTLHYTDGSASTASDGHLEVPVSGTATTVTLTYVGGVAGDVVTAYINGEAGACTDNFTITQGTGPTTTTTGGGGGGSSSGGGSSAEVCSVDVTEESSDTLSCGENYQMNICTNGEDVTVTSSDNNEICYYLDENDNGEQDSGEAKTCEEGSVELNDNNDCYEVTVNNVCEETTVSMEQNGKVCEENTIETTGELGEFNKYIYTFNFSAEKNSYSDEGIFFAHDEDRAFYTLEYNPSGDENEIVFTDDMWTNGYIEAEDGGGTVDLATTYGELTSGYAYTYTTITRMGFGKRRDGVWLEEKSGDLATYVDGLGTSVPSFIPYIKYDGSTPSSPIEECQYDSTSGDLINTNVCYDPSETPKGSHEVVIENAGTVTDGSIRIRYVGVVNSNLDCTSDTDTCLTEEFQNEATVDAFPGTSGNTLDASARLVILCSYLLTENAGDVYLNEAIQGGSDLACITTEGTGGGSDYSGYSNTEGLIISPDTSISGGTSTTTTPDYAAETISLCDNTDSGSLIGNLSSYVCEIVTSVSDLWKMSSVETTTDSHVSQATRNASTNQVAGDSSYANWNELSDALTNTNNEDSHILYFDGDISNGDPMTLSGIDVPCGAWTLIVENADLIITGNIAYATTCTDGSNINLNLPSVAFVVQGGDIYFKNTSHHNVGVYYTDGNLYGNSNDVNANHDWRSPVNGQLTIDGSLYGNVQPLIDAARYVAPPETEGGGLVVRYDSRILLNTPPSLSEYVDVSTEKAIN